MKTTDAVDDHVVLSVSRTVCVSTCPLSCACGVPFHLVDLAVAGFFRVFRHSTIHFRCHGIQASGHHEFGGRFGYSRLHGSVGMRP